MSRYSLLLAFPMLLPAIASADVVYTKSFTLGGGTAGPVSDQALIQVGYISTPGNPSPPRTLFQNRTFTNADIGKTITVSSNLDDPNFSLFASTLTDGQIQQFGASLSTTGGGGPTGVTNSEPREFFGDLNDPRIDFHGFTIDSLSFTLTALAISTGAPPNSYSATFTVSLNAHPAPEPTTALLLATPLAFLLRRRQRA